MKTGIELIAEERQRQIDREGYDCAHDNEHTEGQLVRAAICYATERKFYLEKRDSEHRERETIVQLPDKEGNMKPHQVLPPIYGEWPWGLEYWKPTPNDRVKELVKAGALIAAEIDRLQRLNG